MLRILFLALLSLPLHSSVRAQISQEGELKKWHKVTLTMDGPKTGEENMINPFLHYRLNVTFRLPPMGTQRKQVLPTAINGAFTSLLIKRENGATKSASATAPTSPSPSSPTPENPCALSMACAAN